MQLTPHRMISASFLEKSIIAKGKELSKAHRWWKFRLKVGNMIAQIRPGKDTNVSNRQRAITRSQQHTSFSLISKTLATHQ